MAENLIRAARSDEVTEGQLLAVEVAGRSVLLSRVAGRAVAVANVCPHMGLAMTRGQVEDGVLRCPWHGSRFDICSGANLDWVNAFLGAPMPKWTHKVIAMGKAPAPLQTLSADERDGEVFVAAPVPAPGRR